LQERRTRVYADRLGVVLATCTAAVRAWDARILGQIALQRPEARGWTPEAVVTWFREDASLWRLLRSWMDTPTTLARKELEAANSALTFPPSSLGSRLEQKLYSPPMELWQLSKELAAKYTVIGMDVSGAVDQVMTADSGPASWSPFVSAAGAARHRWQLLSHRIARALN